MKMQKPKTVFFSVIVLTATFILGALTGAGILWISSPCPMKGPFPPPAGGPFFYPLPLRELSLSEEQDEQILKILEEHKPSLEKIFEDSFPKIKKETSKIEKEIRKILNAEQKQLFDEMIEKREQNMKNGKPSLSPPKPPFKNPFN